MARDTYIVEAVRTPLGRRRGSLSSVHPVDLGAVALKEVLKRGHVPGEAVADVFMGCVLAIGEQSLNIARHAALAAGYPIEVPAVTIDRQCGSGLQAINFGASMIGAGQADVIVAGGVESMSRIPIGSNRDLGPGDPYTPALMERDYEPNQGLAAEKIVERWGFTREELDAFSYESHQRAHQAQVEGRFRREIVPVETCVEGRAVVVEADDGIRPDTSLEKLAALKPAFKADGAITAGNSSQITDGAAALLLMSQAGLDRYEVQPRARVVAQCAVGSDPSLMLTGPLPATERVLQAAGMTLADIDLFEVNEAFAPVPLLWLREFQVDPARLNVNGGAIALGHPVGASGARLVVTLLHELERHDGSVGLVTLCVGGGLGVATIIERI